MLSEIKPKVIDRNMGGTHNPSWRGKERLLRGSDHNILVINLEQ